MSKKARLADLNRQIRAVPDKPKATDSPRLEANPERGQRGDFLNITVRLPAEMLTEIQSLGVKRRQQKKSNRTQSAIIREAIADLIQREMGKKSYCAKCKEETQDGTRLEGKTFVGGGEKTIIVCGKCGSEKSNS